MNKKELEKLTLQHRDVLIQYFFESKTMNQIAVQKGVSQPTVSRMINAAVEALRTRLRKKGIIVASIVLAGFIEKSTLHAAPAVLLTEVGKMSLVGTTSGVLTSSTVASSGTATVAAGSGSLSAISAGTVKTAVSVAFSTVKAKVITAVAITAIGTGTFIAYNHNSQPEIPDTPVAEAGNHTEQATSAFERSNQPIALGNQMGGGGMGGAMRVTRKLSSGEDDIQVGLADPEVTIDSFTELLISDNLDLWANCFTHNSQALVNLNRIMTNPRNEQEQQLQNAFNSIGQPVEVLEIENGLAMKLLYTVYDPFIIDKDNKKRTWQEGDQFEINVELVNVDEQWRIANISTVKLLPG